MTKFGNCNRNLLSDRSNDKMIIFLYGGDTFRSRGKLNELKEKFLREVDPSGNSLTALDGEKVSLEKINDSAGASSLLSKKRMVIIENLFTNKSKTIFNEINDYFKNKKDSDNIIIFLDNLSGAEKLPKYKSELFKFLTKQKYAQEFKPLSNTESTIWAKKEIEARGGKVSREAAAELASLLGSDLWQINNEIDKLINFKAAQKLPLRQSLSVEDSGAAKSAQMPARQNPLAGDSAEAGSVIELEDVKNLVRGQFDENIFALTDAISARNKRLAVKLLEEQIEAGLADSYLLTMITRQFKILMQIRQAFDLGQTSRTMASQLKIHPFVVQKGMGQARNFTLPVLKNIFSRLVEIDYLMKSGKAEIRPALSLLIARM